MIEYVGVAVEDKRRGFLGTVPDFGFIAEGYDKDDLLDNMAAVLRLKLNDVSDSYLTVLSPGEIPVTIYLGENEKTEDVKTANQDSRFTLPTKTIFNEQPVEIDLMPLKYSDVKIVTLISSPSSSERILHPTPNKLVSRKSVA